MIINAEPQTENITAFVRAETFPSPVDSTSGGRNVNIDYEAEPDILTSDPFEGYQPKDDAPKSSYPYSGSERGLTTRRTARVAIRQVAATYTCPVTQGTLDPANGGDASVIGRLQVCNNVNRNYRVKGVRVWADKITQDGTTVYDEQSPIDYELPNCESWSTSVVCPPGTMSTGLVVHMTSRESGLSGADRQIVGLGLISRTIATAL